MKPEILLLVPTLPEIEPFLRQQGKGYGPVVTGISPYRCAAATQEAIIQRRPDMMILWRASREIPRQRAGGRRCRARRKRAGGGHGFLRRKGVRSEVFRTVRLSAYSGGCSVADRRLEQRERSGLASCRSERRTDREYGRGRFFRRLPARANTFLGAPHDLEYGRRAFRPMEYSAGDRRAGPSDRPPAANGGKYVPHRAAFRRHISLRPDGIASGRAAKAAYCAAPSAYQAQTKRIETQ